MKLLLLSQLMIAFTAPGWAAQANSNPDGERAVRKLVAAFTEARDREVLA
jgi:hypothetical protein